MHRAKAFGSLAIGAMLLVTLTGCPSMISNVVGQSESVQQAIDQADPGDGISFKGTHNTSILITTDGITLSGEDGATIDGNVKVDADNVTLENFTINGKLDTPTGSFSNLTLSSISAYGNTLSGTFTCTVVVQPSESIGSNMTDGTVCVAPGTYEEQITIDKSATIMSLGSSDNTTIAPPSSLSGTDSLITVQGSSVTATVNGFTIAGPMSGLDHGVYVREKAEVTIINNEIVDLRRGSLGSGGVAIYVGDRTVPTSGSATIANNTFTGYAKSAVVVDSMGSQATIRNNTITGAGETGKVQQNGIQVSHGAKATITNNTIENHKYEPTGEAATGIAFGSAADGVSVNDNTIRKNEVGLAIRNTDQAVIKGNDIVNNKFDTDSSFGVVIQGESSNNEIRDNDIRDNWTGIGISPATQDGPAPSSNEAQGNNIVGNEQFAVDLRSTDNDFNASNNWWGSDKGPKDVEGNTEASTSNCPNNPKNTDPSDQLGNPVADSVDGGQVQYCPWATSQQ